MNDLETMSAKSKAYTVNQSLQEKALIGGNLADLSPSERLNYYGAICESLGLNPLTRPFEYITLNGKLTLYARKDCTEQLRNSREISIKIVSRELIDGVFIVTSQATNAKGRSDESIGAVPLANLQGDAKANAMMKAETKSKRRVTLSFCGLGVLDESEIDSIPGARVESVSEKPGTMDKGSSVLDKMKSNGHRTPESSTESAQPGDPHHQPEQVPPSDAAPAPSLPASNICQQLRLCESIAEAASIMNDSMQWPYSAEEREQINKVFAETKKRLGKR